MASPLLSKLFGKGIGLTGGTLSSAAGSAAGAAIRRTLDPVLQAETNTVWSKYPDVPPDAVLLAVGVAQGQVSKAAAYKWAKQQGFDTPQMDAFVSVANVGPALGYAFEAWRRDLLTDDEFQTALNRTGLEAQWYTALKALKTRLLDPADLARGIHKGLIPDPGLLAVPAPSGTGKVNAYPVYPIDALAAAEGFGYTKDDLGVLVGLQGNPMGAHEAAQAQFRGVIEPVDYDRAIAEGNTRNEWGDAIREQSRQIPTAHEFFENALRGYSTLADAIKGAAKHGMTEEDATLVYQNQGRPMNVHQITQAIARGAKFNPEPGEIKDPYMASIVEGSLKPAYYELAEALKYVYPAAFQTLNALTKGWIEPKTAEDWLLYNGWEPAAAKLIVSNVGAGGKTTTNTYVTKARGYVFTLLHKTYVDTPVYDAKAREGMTLLGIGATDQDEILKLFKFELTIGPAAAPPPTVPAA